MFDTIFIKIYLQYAIFTVNMSNKPTKEQEDQLKKLKEKPLPPDIRKAVDDKLKNINKPINK